MRDAAVEIAAAVVVSSLTAVDAKSRVFLLRTIAA